MRTWLSIEDQLYALYAGDQHTMRIIDFGVLDYSFSRWYWARRAMISDWIFCFSAGLVILSRRAISSSIFCWISSCFVSGFRGFLTLYLSSIPKVYHPAAQPLPVFPVADSGHDDRLVEVEHEHPVAYEVRAEELVGSGHLDAVVDAERGGVYVTSAGIRPYPVNWEGLVEPRACLLHPDLLLAPVVEQLDRLRFA